MPSRQRISRPAVYQRVLQRAAEACGGPEAMSALLGVPAKALDRWLSGMEPVPARVFLQAVDCVLDGTPDAAREGGRAAAPGAGRLLLLPVVRQLAKDALADALLLHGTSLGNVQLLNPAGKLEIVAQSGFHKEFLKFFRLVSIADASACGVALKLGRQVIVDDVANDPIFEGGAAEIMLRAGARSVQSTPVVAASGRTFGMISTHFSSRGAASGLPSLEPICRRLADTLDQLR